MNTATESMRQVVDACATPGAQPLPLGEDGGPVFAEPWQAELFASTVALSQQGLFSWKHWVEVFSAEIAARPQAVGESGVDAYFRQWLDALESLLTSRGVVSRDDIVDTHEHWRRSYINTEHGHPVQFSRDWSPPPPAIERWLAEHADHDDHEHGDDEHDAWPRPIAVSPAQKKEPT
ncbi:MAG TPA: nitrile hydratase accessory protein [Burkholderiaceae bacterium]|nr:nitrile hydratase accessory protein [Burkholderiaceae bacterium]